MLCQLWPAHRLCTQKHVSASNPKCAQSFRLLDFKLLPNYTQWRHDLVVVEMFGLTLHVHVMYSFAVKNSLPLFSNFTAKMALALLPMMASMAALAMANDACVTTSDCVRSSPCQPSLCVLGECFEQSTQKNGENCVVGGMSGICNEQGICEVTTSTTTIMASTTPTQSLSTAVTSTKASFNTTKTSTTPAMTTDAVSYSASATNHKSSLSTVKSVASSARPTTTSTQNPFLTDCSLPSNNLKACYDGDQACSEMGTCNFRVCISVKRLDGSNCSIASMDGQCLKGRCISTASSTFSVRATSFVDTSTSAATTTTRTVDVDALLVADSGPPQRGTAFVEATLSLVATDRSTFLLELFDIATILDEASRDHYYTDPILDISYYTASSPAQSAGTARLRLRLRILGEQIAASRVAENFTALVSSDAFVETLQTRLPMRSQVIETVALLDGPSIVLAAVSTSAPRTLAVGTSGNGDDSIIGISLGVVAVLLLVLIAGLLMYRRSLAGKSDLESVGLNGLQHPQKPSGVTTIMGRKSLKLSSNELKSSLIGSPSTVLQMPFDFNDHIPGAVFASRELASVGRSQANTKKNRSLMSVPYDRNRVRLNAGLPDQDYINASYIEGYKPEHRFIACQGPLESTCADFWRMVWEQGVEVIVMLTNAKEGDKVKCHEYWPERNGMEEFGDVQVVLDNDIVYGPFIVRDITMRHLYTEQVNKIKHIQYLQWADHDVPEEPAELLQLLALTKQHASKSRQPVVVHGSRGAGRTGSFLAAHIELNRFDNERKLELFQTFVRLRQSRMRMIESLEQYIFVLETLIHYALDKDDGSALGYELPMRAYLSTFRSSEAAVTMPGRRALALAHVRWIYDNKRAEVPLQLLLTSDTLMGSIMKDGESYVVIPPLPSQQLRVRIVDEVWEDDMLQIQHGVEGPKITLAFPSKQELKLWHWLLTDQVGLRSRADEMGMASMIKPTSRSQNEVAELLRQGNPLTPAGRAAIERAFKAVAKEIDLPEVNIPVRSSSASPMQAAARSVQLPSSQTALASNIQALDADEIESIRELAMKAQRAKFNNEANAELRELELLLRTAEVRTQQAHAFEQMEAARTAEVNAFLQRQRDAIAVELDLQQPSAAPESESELEETPERRDNKRFSMSLGSSRRETIYFTDQEDSDADEDDRPPRSLYDLTAGSNLAGLLASLDDRSLLDTPLPADSSKPKQVSINEPPAGPSTRRQSVSETSRRKSVSEASRASGRQASQESRKSDALEDDEEANEPPVRRRASYSHKPKLIPVKRSIGGLVLARGAAKRLARNTYHQREQKREQEQKAAEEEAEEDIKCTYLGNCMCKECREERGE
eukprot:TRINITY_DN11776_c0_g3_i1.p1 TRINITY_DN11776_c0_g3~~TRINITY_DN11776_c0_g3_i1.p1  ORF type:complete len:1344 (+),score=289.51 TRINITY_DN11776_c0_g3_i1:952-4983(+)